ncbi:MAG: glycine cleavage system aminomethyltransferase GcvT [Bacteroidetes bacterium]|jgi:aminomethyltransferase|nr:glycine cleavage system protein T [Crocinitomicaceae bacterium]MCH9822857.1 glycine cleavage system aminomethyltransferase GcvT [Bacteroidota bacterium]MDA9967852.1 glycine cleavage system aminomethyltransferase GcvT [Salibacteraceae bacterium]|tara:strand:- start:54333 stop:55418 length:1086 start_codon:yes stop_codon:yes gene_type:complete
MKNTALTDKHIELGAKMVPFAGYNMPVQYTGVNQEHIHVRSAVGVFDVSHMGEFYVRGEEAEQLVQKVTTNDVSQLFDGKIQYSCLPNGKGGIVDDLLVYRISSQEFLLVVNASNIEKDWNWISSQNTFKATMENKSDELSLLAIQGPKATVALQSLTDINLKEMEYYTFKIGSFAGIDNVIVSATGYTGAGGFEIYFPNENANDIWNAVFEAGASNDIQPIGLAARDTLRLEMGFCLYGNDIDDSTSPLEAGLGWITKLNKGEFIDKDYLANQKEAGLSRRLCAFEMVDKGIPRQGYPIVDAEGNEIGVVTSGTMSPSLKMAIGLGYVNLPTNKVGNEIFISVRNKSLKASVVKLPFYKG